MQRIFNSETIILEKNTREYSNIIQLIFYAYIFFVDYRIIPVVFLVHSWQQGQHGLHDQNGKVAQHDLQGQF